MRKILTIGITIVLVYSCTSDAPSGDKVIDSLKSTTKIDILPNDTLKIDSSTGVKILYDCTVLNRIIPFDNGSKNQISQDLNQLLNCGIDSFDFKFVVPNLFSGFVSENQVQGKKNITYRDFIKHIIEFKSTLAYFQVHAQIKTLDSLRSKPFDIHKVYAMKPTLGKLGFTQTEWEMFSGFAQSYPVPKKGVFTWGEMLEAFDKFKPKI